MFDVLVYWELQIDGFTLDICQKNMKFKFYYYEKVFVNENV